MTYLQSIFLGILQGVAEFLPISSSGHLAAFQLWMGLPEVPLIYDVLLHVATLLVVLFYFRALILRLCVVLWRRLRRKNRPEDAEDEFLLLAVIITTAVTFAGYLFFKLILGDRMETLKSNQHLVFSCFLITGIMLAVQGGFHPRNNGFLRPWQAFGVGVGQIFGLLPGISRSGATISAAVFCRIDRKRAGELSFLASIPAIVGAVVFDLKDAVTAFSAPVVDGSAVSAGVVSVGMLFAFLSGMLSFPLLLKLLQKEKLWLFSLYLIPLGIGGLIWSAVG